MEKGHRESYIETMNQWGAEGKPFIFIIDFEMKEPIVLPLQEAAENGIYFTFDNTKNIEYQSVNINEFTFRRSPVSFAIFKKSFDQVMNEIKKGNSFLTNLTFPTPVETNLTLKEIFLRSDAPYKLLFKESFVVFSPEPFITIRGQKISSFPMKGTIDASIPNAGSKILSDRKETAEHHTIVDMIRSDLSRVATNVKVEKFRFLDTVKTHDKVLLQVSSEVTGELPDNYRSRLGTILSELLACRLNLWRAKEKNTRDNP